VSALLWIGQPAAGVAFFHTPHVALYLYGVTAAVWLVVPLRCAFDVPRWAWPLMALLGYCAGSSSRAIGAATLIGVLLMLRAVPQYRRATWMWVALGGLVVGVIAGYASPPWIEFGRVVRRGLEQNLTGTGLLRYALQETGEIVALVATFVLLDIVLGVLLGRERASGEPPNPSDTLRWALAACITSIWCLFGPRYNEATLLPVTVMLVIAALPYLTWLASSRLLRGILIATAVGVHAIAWPILLAKYHRFGSEGFARLEAFERTPDGAIAFVRPYSQVPPSFWFFGEDLGNARQRSLLAIAGFGLRDIVFDPPHRRIDLNPGLHFALEVEGVTREQLQSARAPTIWASEPSAARKQFEIFIKRLRATVANPVARLVVKNVTLAEAGKRPLLAAWCDGKRTMIPRVARSPLDENSRYTVRVYGDDARQFKEAFVIDSDNATAAEYARGSVRLQPLTMGLNVVVLCNPERCLVADAFVPRF